MSQNSSKTQRNASAGTKAKTKTKSTTATKTPTKKNDAVGKKSNSKNSISKFKDTVGEDNFKNIVGAAISILQKNYGDYKISQDAKKEIALVLDADGNVANGWASIVDVLDFIDITRIATERPEEMSAIVSVLKIFLSAIFPAFAPLISSIPETMIIEFVATAGQLSPEHVLKLMIQQKMVGEQEKEDVESSTNILSKLPRPSLPGFPPRKEAVQPACIETTVVEQVEKTNSEEDIFETLKKLAELKNMGIISDEEFNSKKVELLARI